MQLEPQTGRNHPLLCLMAPLRYPIIGDTTQGSRQHNKLYRNEFDIERLWLSAKALGSAHPVTGEPVWIECELEPVWQALLQRFERAAGISPWGDSTPSGPAPAAL
ncbi:hypothetical protein [Ferrimonas pelagia]|uniref:Uncharacterized protein n=1 Tax=Ferrimonas pelagia TaxID=1177826 RepID=A0ABP9EIZ1_9GAMM